MADVLLLGCDWGEGFRFGLENAETQVTSPEAYSVAQSDRQFIFSYGTFPSAGIAVTVDNTLHIHACGETVDFDPSYFLRNELALYEIYFQRESGGGLLFGVNGPEYGAGRRADGWTADYLDDAGFVIGRLAVHG